VARPTGRWPAAPATERQSEVNAHWRNSSNQNTAHSTHTHTQQTQTQKKEERTAFSNLRGFASFTVSNDRVVVVGEALFGRGCGLCA
jgi:hypothetical protein